MKFVWLMISAYVLYLVVGMLGGGPEVDWIWGIPAGAYALSWLNGWRKELWAQ